MVRVCDPPAGVTDMLEVEQHSGIVTVHQIISFFFPSAHDHLLSNPL